DRDQDVRRGDGARGPAGCDRRRLLHAALSVVDEQSARHAVQGRCRLQVGQDIDLAMQRGEIDGRAGNYLSTLRSINGDWLRDKSSNLLVQIGHERDPDFPDVPLLTEFAKSDEIRRVLQVFEAEISVGRAFLTTPDVSGDRLAALRQAFDATMQDD